MAQDMGRGEGVVVMGQYNQKTCPRGLNRCRPLSNIVSDGAETFVCVGYGRVQDRTYKQDRFTHCWKGSDYDQMVHSDRRDLLDTVMVITTALSLDENNRVALEVTEEQMNGMDLLSSDEMFEYEP